MIRGGSRIFFRRGYTRLLIYFNTNKPHSFFFCRIPVVLENRKSSQGGGGAHPLHPPPRSAPDDYHTVRFVQRKSYSRTILDKIKWNSKPPWSPPPQKKSRMKPREGQKRAIFPSLIWGGGGGLDFPFILSKIIVSLAAVYSNKHPTSN